MFLFIVSRMNHIKNKKKRTGLQYQQYCTVLNANQKSIFLIFLKKISSTTKKSLIYAAWVPSIILSPNMFQQ